MLYVSETSAVFQESKKLRNRLNELKQSLVIFISRCLSFSLPSSGKRSFVVVKKTKSTIQLAQASRPGICAARLSLCSPIPM